MSEERKKTQRDIITTPDHLLTTNLQLFIYIFLTFIKKHMKDAKKNSIMVIVNSQLMEAFKKWLRCLYFLHHE